MGRQGFRRSAARGDGPRLPGGVTLRLLLDTHIIIWSLLEPRRLSPATRTAIVDPANTVFVSAASTWEISTKSALGRLGFPLDGFDGVLARMGIEPLPISLAHAIAAGSARSGRS